MLHTKYINILQDIENTVSNMTSDDLEVFASETQQTLEALIGELKRRKEAKQHIDVCNLNEHLESADTSYKSLKEYISMLLKEIKNP